MPDEILLERLDGGVCLMTLNRAESLNAIDRAMTKRLRAAIQETETDPAIKIVLVQGAGDKAFCVGVDLKERQTLSDQEAQSFRMGELFPMYEELEARQKPSIALVNGHCLGGGFEIALACDMILATPESKFGLPEVKWGLIPAGGGCRKLPRLIGAARAKEFILTGSSMPADRAEALGIVNRVVEKEYLLRAGLELAAQIAANVQVAVTGAKRSIDQALDCQRSMVFDIEVANFCYASKERKAGISSFVARKQPASTDK